VATLKTPARIRQLQRALYLRAKQDQPFRAYALYDKVYRPDILAHAYALAKANGGAPGPDGCTFEQIEADGPEGLLTELREAQGVATHPRRAAAEDATDGLEPPGDGGRAQPVHPGCAAVFSSGSPTNAALARLLRRSPHRALVGPETWASPAGMVARVPGGALAATRLRAVGPPGCASSSFCKACAVNVEGSRMREIRTYGLMRGRWSVRLARRTGAYSTHAAKGSAERKGRPPPQGD
jgi:hypothetical protein